MRKKIILEVGPKASKALLALGKIKKSLDIPLEDISSFIQTVKSLSENDPSNLELKNLLDQLNSIVAYVGGAGSDLFNLQANLRSKKDIVTRLDANLPANVVEAAVRRAIRKIIKESLKTQ